MTPTHVRGCAACGVPFKPNTMHETIGKQTYCIPCADKLWNQNNEKIIVNDRIKTARTKHYRGFVQHSETLGKFYWSVQPIDGNSLSIHSAKTLDFETSQEAFDSMKNFMETIDGLSPQTTNKERVRY